MCSVPLNRMANRLPRASLRELNIVARALISRKCKRKEKLRTSGPSDKAHKVVTIWCRHYKTHEHKNQESCGLHLFVVLSFTLVVGLCIHGLTHMPNHEMYVYCVDIVGNGFIYFSKLYSFCVLCFGSVHTPPKWIADRYTTPHTMHQFCYQLLLVLNGYLTGKACNMLFCMLLPRLANIYKYIY